MPHKRNPVLTENLTGLARMVRGYVTPALENVALWHERDISHSSVERMIGPDATVTLDFALNRLAGVIDKLVVYPKNMQKNLDRLGGLVHSQRVLIALTKAGVSREDAYRIVQKNAMRVWRDGEDFCLAQGRSEGAQGAQAERDRGELRPQASLQARRYDFQARVRQGLSLSSARACANPSHANSDRAIRGHSSSAPDLVVRIVLGGCRRRRRGRRRRKRGIAAAEQRAVGIAALAAILDLAPFAAALADRDVRAGRHHQEDAMLRARAVAQVELAVDLRGARRRGGAKMRAAAPQQDEL